MFYYWTHVHADSLNGLTANNLANLLKFLVTNNTESDDSALIWAYLILNIYNVQ